MQAVFTENWLTNALNGFAWAGNIFQNKQPAGSMTAQCFAKRARMTKRSKRGSHICLRWLRREKISGSRTLLCPSKLAIQTILDARKRGVKVEIIVPGKIDYFAVRMASRSRWGKLLDAGVEFYEYQPTLYHCKIMIVDDIWATVGSVNFDEKSFRANDEANMNVLDREFAATLIQNLRRRQKQIAPSDQGRF